MEDLQEKIHFLKSEFAKKLSQADASAPAAWGKMNLQQMVEHMTEYVDIAAGKVPVTILTPEERIPAAQDFIRSEKAFRENTPNSLMPDTPQPVRNEHFHQAVAELQSSINRFFEVFEKEPEKTIANPFFGYLDFSLQIQLLYKHAHHHLRQFGIS